MVEGYKEEEAGEEEKVDNLVEKVASAKSLLREEKKNTANITTFNSDLKKII